MMPPAQMSVRLELFVQDMDQTIAFYSHILGFEVLRRAEDYASLKNGTFILGLGPITKLPAESGGYFTRSRLRSALGLGVEIVLEVDDVHAAYAYVQSCGYLIEEQMQKRDWGLTDFRLVDPNGYYLRITSRA
jgi:lactoylglutathione lyase